MQSTDRFLWGIVAGVVLLAAVVFLIALQRPDQPVSGPDDTPEGVAYNYLVAVQVMDYERAYGYLSPDLPRYPDSPDAFAAEVDGPWLSRVGLDDDMSLIVDRVRTKGDRATVSINQVWFEQGGLFDSGERTVIVNVNLRLSADGWRIVRSESFWNMCWSDPALCPPAPPANYPHDLMVK